MCDFGVKIFAPTRSDRMNLKPFKIIFRRKRDDDRLKVVLVGLAWQVSVCKNSSWIEYKYDEWMYKWNSPEAKEEKIKECQINRVNVLGKPNKSLYIPRRHSVEWEVACCWRAATWVLRFSRRDCMACLQRKIRLRCLVSFLPDFCWTIKFACGKHV